MRDFLVFDLGETLIDFCQTGKWRDNLKYEVLPAMYAKLQSISKKFSVLKVNIDDFVSDSYLRIALGGDPSSMVSRIENLLNFYAISIENHIVEDLIEVFFESLKKNAIMYVESMEILQILHQNGFTLGLWSNTPWQSPGYLSERIMKQFGIDQFFKVKLFSGDHGIRKPDPHTLELVSKTAKIKKERMIYIGNAAVDIQTGMSYGIPTVWVKKNGDKMDNSETFPSFEIETLAELKTLMQTFRTME